MSTKHDIELRAAAAAASVLVAQLIRRDVSGAQQTRDFDLVLPDGSLEPLEVTRHVDRPAYETWERLRRGAGNIPAPSLTRVWAVAAPSSTPTTGGPQPYDIRSCDESWSRPWRSLSKRDTRRSSSGGYGATYRARSGRSSTCVSRTVCHTSRSRARRRTSRSAPRSAASHFRTSSQRRSSLRPPTSAIKRSWRSQRAHAAVTSSLSSTARAAALSNAVDRGLIGRLPTLPPPITTASAATGGNVLVTTPPASWERHELPRVVFNDPERWLVAAR